MKINCSICEAQFVSLVIDNEIALHEVSNKLTKHLETKHPAEFRNMKNTIATVATILPWFIQMTHFAQWSDDETFLETEYQKLVEEVSNATGLLIEIDEEDGEISEDETLTTPPESATEKDEVH
jgi:hypothetical protein